MVKQKLAKIVEGIAASPCFVENAGLIYNGDCLKILGQLPSGSIDLILTDPPYGVGWNANRLRNDSPGRAIMLFAALSRHASRLLKPGACFCCFCSSSASAFPVMQTWIDILRSHLEYRGTIVWDKLSVGVGSRYRQTHEYILWASRDGAKCRWFGSQSASSILRFARSKPHTTGHPTPKPIQLLRELVLNHSTKDDLVLDPFCGSGSTLIAAKATGRRFIGIELDRSFAYEAVHRAYDQ